jgi:ABC-type branched-subunit amino acid transport system ATPase component
VDNAGAREMDPILEIRNITKKFGGLTAVDDFSMHLAA